MAKPRKLPARYPAITELAPLKALDKTKRGDERYCHLHRVLCKDLAHFLRCTTTEVKTLARKLEVLHVRRHNGNRQLWVTLAGAERIIILVRARQGATELLKQEQLTRLSGQRSRISLTTPATPREPGP